MCKDLPRSQVIAVSSLANCMQVACLLLEVMFTPVCASGHASIGFLKNNVEHSTLSEANIAIPGQM